MNISCHLPYHIYLPPDYRDQDAPVVLESNNETLTLKLTNLTVSELRWISVWDRRSSVDFGSLVLKTETEATEEKNEKSNDLEKSNQTPSLTVNGKGREYFLLFSFNLIRKER